MFRIHAALLFALALTWACAEPQPFWQGDPLAAPQTVSLQGEELYAVEDTTGAIAGADAALLTAPDDIELLLAAARVRWNFLQFRQAIAMYDAALESAPDDWRLYTARGNRRTSLREFQAASADLERARELAPLNYDVSYFLAFSYYLQGRFEEAANELLRCFEVGDTPEARDAQSPTFRSCSQAYDDVDWRVAITDWTIRSLRRAGRHDEAAQWLDSVPDELPVRRQLGYYQCLRYYKGLQDASEMDGSGTPGGFGSATVGYCVANWHYLEGDTEAAFEMFEAVAADPSWSAYGRIASEVELVRRAADEVS